VYVEEGITHYCVANMPGAYARTATQALTNVTARFVEYLAEGGVEGAIRKEPRLATGINVMDGSVRNKAVAEAHQLPFTEL
jgi:alanine dehydrogenase